jgi:hypothetical protein
MTAYVNILPTRKREEPEMHRRMRRWSRMSNWLRWCRWSRPPNTSWSPEFITEEGHRILLEMGKW